MEKLKKSTTCPDRGRSQTQPPADLLANPPRGGQCPNQNANNPMTLYEKLDNLHNTLLYARRAIAHGNLDNTETCPGIGDFIKAECEHPVLIRYQYDTTGIAQGYRVGPLCILRLKPDSEQAIEIWLDIDETLEATMPEDVLEPYRELRRVLDEMEHDGRLEIEFEIPQALIDNLTPCPLMTRTGTLRALTRPTGAPVPDELKLTLQVNWTEPEWRREFKELVGTARTTRTAAFAKRKPKLEDADDQLKRNTRGSENHIKRTSGQVKAHLTGRGQSV